MPHGGGGPGAGPIGVKSHLVPFLPGPLPAKNEQGYFWEAAGPQSIGRVRANYGNFLSFVRLEMRADRAGNVAALSLLPSLSSDVLSR